jgi:hypothetical protein
VFAFETRLVCASVADCAIGTLVLDVAGLAPEGVSGLVLAWNMTELDPATDVVGGESEVESTLDLDRKWMELSKAEVCLIIPWD